MHIVGRHFNSVICPFIHQLVLTFPIVFSPFTLHLIALLSVRILPRDGQSVFFCSRVAPFSIVPGLNSTGTLSNIL